MKTTPPLISVIMPVYNRAGFLPESIESILGQAWGDFEFIIVDDGSGDAGPEVIRSYRDPRIRLLVNSCNTGNYPSRNRGCRVARGRYICVMDSDDIAMPDRLERQFRYMESHPETGIAGSNCIRIPENRPSSLDLSYEAFRVGLLANSMIFFHPTLILRKAALDRFGLGYDERFIFAADYELLTRASRLSPVVNMEEPLLQYRKHNERITTRHPRVQRFMVKQIRKRYLSVLGLRPTPAEMHIHFTLMWGGGHGLSPADVRQWLDKIRAANRETGYFDDGLLEKLLAQKSGRILKTT